MAGLLVRKLADTSEERVKVHDPRTGAADLYTPEDAAAIAAAVAEVMAGYSPTPYPLAGVELLRAPEEASVSQGYVAEGKAEGWITTVPEQVEQPVVRSAGPAEDPWKKVHTFIHYDEITFHTVRGPVVYEVTQNPDKWPEEKDGAAGHGGDVYDIYVLKLVSAPSLPAEGGEEVDG